MRRSFWIIQVGPKSNDKCPEKRHTEKGGQYGQKAGTGVMQSPGVSAGKKALLTP